MSNHEKSVWHSRALHTRQNMSQMRSLSKLWLQILVPLDVIFGEFLTEEVEIY